jgi:hypothetical protein
MADEAKAPQAAPIDAALTKVCDEYQVAADNALTKLLAEIDEVKQKTEASKTLKAELKIRTVEQLDRERKEVERASLKPPTSEKVRGAVNEYKRKITAASKKCMEAFDEAAEEYSKVQDLDKAKEVLQEKEQFARGIRQADGFTAESLWYGEFDVPTQNGGLKPSCWLEIIERTPGRFKGRFEGYGQVLEVNGIVSARGIRWDASDVKVIQGDPAASGTGDFSGGSLELTFNTEGKARKHPPRVMLHWMERVK